MNLEKRGWCVVRGINKEPVSLDEPSGGYPYSSNNVANVKIWENKDDAAKYAVTMQGHQNMNYSIARCVLKLEILGN